VVRRKATAGAHSPVYCDVLHWRSEAVVPVAGSPHSAMRIDPLWISEPARSELVDVCAGAPPREELLIRAD